MMCAGKNNNQEIQDTPPLPANKMKARYSFLKRRKKNRQVHSSNINNLYQTRIISSERL